jgi:excisionase family DNA binding protein
MDIERTNYMTLINNDYYTVAEVAALHGVSEKSVRRWIKSGGLAAETYRRMLWIDKKTAEAFTKPKRGRGDKQHSTK